MRRVLYERAIDVGTGFSSAEDITDRVRLYTLDLTENAEEGSVALSSMTIDDPNGDYEIVGWRRIWVLEDAAVGSNKLTYHGWIGDREVDRGPFEVGSARQWVCTLSDFNALLGLRVFHNPDADRPDETDVQRIQWMLSTLGTPGIAVSEFVSTASPKNMDAADYRGQTRLDLITDCAQQSGKNYFVYVKDNGDGTSDRGLWYDFASSTAYSSPIRLSNVLTDVDNTWTFAIARDTKLTRDPSRTYSGAYVRYDGGAAYEESITTANFFTRRDAVYDASNVKHLSTATNRALRYLGTTDVEEDRIDTAYWVPAAKVNFVKPGQRVQFRASHLPGYESFTWLRVLQRKFLEVSEAPELTYLVSLTLASAAPITAATCSARGGQLVVHAPSEPAFPNRLWDLYTGSAWNAMVLRVQGIPGGDYTYNIPAGQCKVWLNGSALGDTSGGVPFDGVTWTPNGGTATYYPENGDGNAGHFFQYTIAIPNSFTAAASVWSFPEYQRVVAAAIGGHADYGLGLTNSVAFELP